MPQARTRLTASVLGFGIVTLLLSSCSSIPEPIEITTRPIEKPELVLPEADELNARPVKFFIITEDNIEEKFEELKNSGMPVVFFAMTSDGYENVSLNLSDLRAYIMQQKTIIAAYEEYYKASQDALNGAVIIE